MTVLQKFMFDTDFTDPEALNPGPAVEPEPEPPTFSEADMAAARAEGLAAGREEALRDTAGMLEKIMADTLERLGGRLDALFATQAEANGRSAAEAVTVAVTVLRKLFPELTRRGGEDEIRGLLDEVMARVHDEPRLTVRVNDRALAPIEARLKEALAARAYAGQVTCLGDPELPEGDCRVEWSDGGAERHTAALWQDIDAIIERNLGLDRNEPPGDTHG